MYNLFRGAASRSFVKTSSIPLRYVADRPTITDSWHTQIYILHTCVNEEAVKSPILFLGCRSSWIGRLLVLGLQHQEPDYQARKEPIESGEFYRLQAQEGRAVQPRHVHVRPNSII
jgi:hypothetical protein